MVLGYFLLQPKKARSWEGYGRTAKNLNLPFRRESGTQHGLVRPTDTPLRLTIKAWSWTRAGVQQRDPRTYYWMSRVAGRRQR